MAKKVSCHYNSKMQKFLKAIWVLVFILASFTLPQVAQAESAGYAPAFSSASDLIAGVNAVRSSNGLNTLQPNSILDTIAQQQAEYELSIGAQTDTGRGGSRPYQRALAAGYLLAGDLSKGGIIAELLYGGVGIGASAAVTGGIMTHTITPCSSVLPLQMLVQAWQLRAIHPTLFSWKHYPQAERR